MLLLPLFLQTTNSIILEATIDSILLSCITAPIFWYTVVGPLHNLAMLRQQYFDSLFDSMEEQRKNWSHEIHDGIGQSLTMLVSGLKSFEWTSDHEGAMARIRQLRSAAENALQETRRLARGLHPSLLEDLGISAAIERLAAEFQQHHGVHVVLELDGRAGESSKNNLALYRICQESLQNAVKHSRAKNILIRLQHSKHEVELSIFDDGVGIPDPILHSRIPKTGHLGLDGIRERARARHGQATITSVPEKGTRIHVTLPRLVSRG